MYDAPRRRPAAKALTAFVAVALSAATATTAFGATATTKKTTATAKKAATTAKKTTAKKAVIYQPNGRPPNPAAPFLWNTASTDPALPGVGSFEAATQQLIHNRKEGLFSLVIIGTDARANENPQRTRADSIHLFVWNPATNKGTIIGIPRDTYVDVPGRGKRKINEATVLGGPTLLCQTITNMTNKRLPCTRWVITGFKGFVNMINDVGGVNVLVDPAMNDTTSGATFAKGWFAMNGNAALAFNRNRKSLANGDFGRSLNHGRFLVYTLAKLREEVSDVPGLIRWIQSFRRNGATNIPVSDMLVMAQMVRGMNPNEIMNVVAAGKAAKVSGADVIQLDLPRWFGLVDDVARDGLNDQR